MSCDYTKLWRPIKINKMRLRNRIMLSAMGTFTPMQDGTDSEEGIRYYEERAKGGAGLIMTGAMFLSEKDCSGRADIGTVFHQSNSEGHRHGRTGTQMGRKDLPSAFLRYRKKRYAGYRRKSTYFVFSESFLLQFGNDLQTARGG